VKPTALVFTALVGVLGFSASHAAAYANPGDTNSTNIGQNIQAGSYFNTSGSRTTFTNTAAGGLWLHSGDLTRGLETTGSGSASSSSCNTPTLPVTGNGGTLYFRNPNGVVRLDGNIDVSAIRAAQSYTANGGKVFVDSAYLYQNGKLFANGVNGAGSTPQAGSVIGIENGMLNRQSLPVGNSVEAQGGMFRIFNNQNN